MRSSSAHDAYVVVSGHQSGVGGQAPLDIGNTRDNGMQVDGSVGIARFIAGSGLSESTKRDAFTNLVANFISHEVGHSFGLKHIDVVARPNAISLMTPLVGVSNLSFGNAEIPVQGEGTQFAHNTLTANVGASKYSWAAVLREGQLTIQGSSAGNILTAASHGNGTLLGALDLFVDSQRYYVDLDSNPGLNSLNPYKGTPISAIIVNGGDGNDLIHLVGVPVAVSAYVYGGDGDDTTIATNLSKLFELRNGWTGIGSYSVRSASAYGKLRGTLIADSDLDDLFGGTDLDVYFYGVNDRLLSTDRGERRFQT